MTKSKIQHLIVQGRQQFNGEVKISGSKNSALPILSATLLSKQKICLYNIPNISDVDNMILLLQAIGSKISIKKDHIEIINDSIKNTILPEKIVNKFRASSLVIGSLITRFKQVTLPSVGGCNIGSRPLDFHFKCLEKMGVNIQKKNDIYEIQRESELKGITYTFVKVSVGATINAILASTKAITNTVLCNIAIEPEVIDTIQFLCKIGFNIKIDKKNRTAKIITTNKTLSAEKTYKYKIISDRIEAATYIIGTAIAGKQIILKQEDIKHIEYLLGILTKINAITIEYLATNKVLIRKTNKKLKPFNIETAPYPYFPTDLQSIMTILATQADGQSTIKENIFENRFKFVKEITKMNGKINIKDNTLLIKGNQSLKACDNIICTDLRGGSAVILAAIHSEGTSIIKDIHHIYRGYENIVSKMTSCNIKLELK